ncbi:ElyC/SanA/YdcF family protein [Sulfurovum sp. ST-21]|nr:ElyC/SanA/YdcF family protein [Sulfurovum indicum]
MEFGFLLKKLISLFLMPLPIGILLTGAGLFFLYRSHLKKARLFILSGMVWLFVFSYAPLGNWLLYQVEQRYAALLSPPKEIRYIYVLGNGHHTDEALPITSQVNKEAIVRLTEGIRLYRLLDGNAKLIVSGYSGLFDPTPHALMQQRLALALGIPKEDIITLSEPEDTQAEAKAARAIAKESPLAVVTSAYHMPRALKWFEHEGLTPYPAPTYHLASIEHPHYLGIFSADALEKSTIAFHEIIGMIWQKVKGV